jgi:26S proteasome regulatory subunit N3
VPEKKVEVKAEIKFSPREQFLKDLTDTVLQLTNAVQLRDRRLQTRAIGRLTSIRKRATVSTLQSIFTQFFPSGLAFLAGISEEEPMDVTPEEGGDEATPATEKKERKVSEEEKKLVASATGLPEVHLFLHLLAALFVFDHGTLDNAISCLNGTLTLLHSQNRRTSDLLSAKVYFYYSLFYERKGQLVSIRSDLLQFHRTACLTHNEPGQTSLATCILRNYLAYNLINQADNFQSKIRFPESSSNNQHARWLYYVGRIESIQLNYSDAYAHLSQAIRKAPRRKETAGFRQSAYKFLIIVQLLMGEVPDRSIFGETELRDTLAPYFQVTKAVRVGDLGEFANVMTEKNKAQFVADHTLSLIHRLRHNVIKTGLRKINLSYSRISISDICDKLQLENKEDAEYIVAKAIHDGVIDAVIDRKTHVMQSRPFVDIYATQEPAAEYHKRIQFCFQTHNDAVKAMSFPPNAHKTQAELDAEAKRNKEQEEPVLDPDAEYDED